MKQDATTIWCKVPGLWSLSQEVLSEHKTPGPYITLQGAPMPGRNQSALELQIRNFTLLVEEFDPGA